MTKIIPYFLFWEKRKNLCYVRFCRRAPFNLREIRRNTQAKTPTGTPIFIFKPTLPYSQLIL